MKTRLVALLDSARPCLILGLVFVLCAWLSPAGPDGRKAFLTLMSQGNMLRAVSEYGILAAGMTLVILTGGIDLSVGSVLAFSAVLFSWLMIWQEVPAWVAIPTCLLAGMGLGAANGWVIARFRIQPFIVTLAMMVVARGLAKLVSGGQKISRSIERGGEFVMLPVPPVFEGLNQRLGELLTVVGLVFLGTLLGLWLIVRHTRFGRHLYAVGGNEEASRLAGIPVGRTKVLAYAISGLVAALAGLCDAAQQEQGDPEAGTTYELDAIAAVVIGGTPLTGGRGSLLLTLLGVLVIGYIDQILSLNNFDQAQRLIAKGVIIVAAVMTQKRS
jgi:ribose transport system permease protein